MNLSVCRSIIITDFSTSYVGDEGDGGGGGVLRAFEWKLTF